MTFPDYLARLKNANPRLFAATEVKIKPSVLIEHLQRAYLEGEAEARGGKLFSDIFPPLSKRSGVDKE